MGGHVMNMGGGGAGGPRPVKLTVTKPPARTTYLVGEAFDPTGMAVEAGFDDGTVLTLAGGYSLEPSGPLQEGDTQVTVSLAMGGKTVSAAVDIETLHVGETLDATSWEDIRKVSGARYAANLWKPGDKKTITLNGAVGTTRFSNLQLDVFILGIDHNAALEGAGIHFAIGKIGDGLVGLADSYCGTSSSGTYAFTMNTGNTNTGGWNKSHMRTAILGADGPVARPKTNTILNVLPSDLRAVMRRVNKYTDNTGGGSASAENVTVSQDYLFLLSEYEIQKANTNANPYEQEKQACYAYFEEGGARIVHKHNVPTAAAAGWCRSPRADGSQYFCTVSVSGNAGSALASCSYALLVGFAV